LQASGRAASGQVKDVDVSFVSVGERANGGLHPPYLQFTPII